ncbi:forkhead box protein J1-A isoform X6 [Drosophila biarmipes]|nr:forkhead box protein J1-A isoform X6 [Drosophila biarmipes]
MTNRDTLLSKSNALIQSYKEDTTLFQEEEDSDDEHELTNLNWLLRNQNLTWPKTIDSSTRETLNTGTKAENRIPNYTHIHRNQIKLTRGGDTVKRSQVIKDPRAQKTTPKKQTPSERFEIFVNKVKKDLIEYEKFASKYETDVTEKPPFNYSHIIGMAMLKNGRITLQQLCAWIEAKFAFFRVRKKWNNSIRHNLSLHHCFRNRKREEKGKGGYWELGVDPKKCDRKR